MNQMEKDQLLDKARVQLKCEFEGREQELIQRHHEELEGVKSDFELRFDGWSREFCTKAIRDTQEIAADAGGLALALAQKIIRDTVEIDRGFLSRTLETALYKIRDNNPLTVVLHPDDVVFMKENPELMDRLHIETVVPDRRVEKGGCLLRAGVREWDASLSRQLDTLAEVVEEALSSGEEMSPITSGGDDVTLLD